LKILKQILKIAFDIGGVIIDIDNEIIFDEAIMSINLFVKKFGKENIYIISKAKQKYIQKNMDHFSKVNFFKKTNMKIDNVIFVPEYIDKQYWCKKLNINYMIDDYIKIIRCILDITPTGI